MTLTPKEAAARLDEAAKEAGGLAAFARKHGLDAANLSRYRAGATKIGGDVAKAVGLQRVVLEAYVPIGAAVDPPAGWTLVTHKERGRRS